MTATGGGVPVVGVEGIPADVGQADVTAVSGVRADVVEVDEGDRLSELHAYMIDPSATNTTAMPRPHHNMAGRVTPGAGGAATTGSGGGSGGGLGLGGGAVCHSRPSQYSIPGLPPGSGYQPGGSGRADTGCDVCGAFGVAASWRLTIDTFDGCSILEFVGGRFTIDTPVSGSVRGARSVLWSSILFPLCP